jgi:uncharacterized repeat protein (TIGR01451 family)
MNKEFLIRVVYVSVVIVVAAGLTLPCLAQGTITTYAGGGRALDGAPALTQNIDAPQSVVADGQGGFYFASTASAQNLNGVYHVDVNGILTLTAGKGPAGFSGDGGPATAAQLNSPTGLALDSNGNLFIADKFNQRIRKVAPTGIITTVAGNGLFGFSGDGALATSARLGSPTDVAVDASGNLLIADNSNNRVRKVAVTGLISTIAGTGAAGFSGDGGAAIIAQLRFPSSIDLDASGDLFIEDSGNFRIRKVTPNGTITTVAGNGTSGFNGDNGPATTAQITAGNIAVDSGGNLFIATSARIRKVTPNGTITTIAGTGGAGFSGDGGAAISAQISSPASLGTDSSGILLIADTTNHRIRRIDSNGLISTLAGNGADPFADDIPAIFSRLASATGVAVDSSGNVLIADSTANRIRKVTPGGIISTFAGTGVFGSGGDGGPAASAQFRGVANVAVDNAGNTFVMECAGGIRKISPSGIITTFSAADNWDFCQFFADYYSYIPTPEQMATDAQGNLYVPDLPHHRVRKITPSGVLLTIAGNGTAGFSGDGGPALAAQFNSPGSVAVDGAGNLYIGDFGTPRIRKVDTFGQITTVAGTGTFGFSGDGGLATAARISVPTSVAVDGAGNLYFADFNFGGSRIRKVTAAGIISTIAGDGNSGFQGDGGPATAARFSFTAALTTDVSGNIFVADTGNYRIRRIGFTDSIPTLTSLSPLLAGQNSMISITLTGSSFSNPLTVDAGTGISAINITVVSDTLATATLIISQDATLGPHGLSVKNSLGSSTQIPLTIVEPFPDLAISSTHSGNVGVGFKTTYALEVKNKGGAPSGAPISIIDTLPVGFRFVSASGTDWSCSASGQTTTCTNSKPLNPGDSTALSLVVDVNADAPSRVTHSPAVTISGDLIPSNNTALDLTTVATPTLFVQTNPVAGQQTTIEFALPAAFPEVISGNLVVTFVPDAVNPLDDPAIQLVTGGRQVDFTIPANTVDPRFGPSMQPGPLLFQPGTVAGTLTFSGTLRTGSIETPFSTTRTIARQSPKIQGIKTTPSNNGLTAAIQLMSTTREVREMDVRFETGSALRLSCDGVAGCSVLGLTFRFDTKTLFDNWFVQDKTFGGLSTIRLPLQIPSTVHGRVFVTLTNTIGASNPLTFPLP